VSHRVLFAALAAALSIGCAHLPETGAQATGEPLAVRTEHVTERWTEQAKVGEVQHRDSSGRSLGTSEIYEDRVVSATHLEWYAAQGNSRIDDADFFRISGDEWATNEVESYRSTGIVMNRVGLGLLAAGAATLLGGYAMRSDSDPGLGLAMTYGSSALFCSGGLLTWMGMARTRESVHPVEMDRAQVAAAAYNAKINATSADDMAVPPAPEFDYPSNTPLTPSGSPLLRNSTPAPKTSVRR
jgi:hypothetical protein